MKLKWKKDGDFRASADQRDDGSYYAMLKLQSGRTYYAIWIWPDDNRSFTDGRELWRDVVYDGPDQIAALAACNEHFKNRSKSVNSHLVSAEQQGG